MEYCESIRAQGKCNKFNADSKNNPTGCNSKGFCVCDDADACDRFLHDDEYDNDED